MIDDTALGVDKIREQAIAQLRKKRDFKAHLLAYVLINAFLIGIWAVTGASFFWPIFPLLGWGIGLAFHAWDVFSPQVPSEDQIQAEMKRLGQRK